MNSNMIRLEIMRQLQNIFEDLVGNAVILTEVMTQDDIEEWDSFTSIQLAMDIESTFHIKIAMQDMKKMSSIKEIIDLILKETAEV